MSSDGSSQQPLPSDVMAVYNDMFPQPTSWSPPSRSPPSRNRRPSNSFPGSIRRIRQACTNCRHRKIKCSGERPRCVNCRRVDRVCNYEPYSATTAANANNNNNNSNSSNNSNNATSPLTAGRGDLAEVLALSKSASINSDLLSRINTIEAQLAKLTSQGALQAAKTSSDGGNTDEERPRQPQSIQALSNSSKSPRDATDGNNMSEPSDSPGSAHSYQPSAELSNPTLPSSFHPSALPVHVMDALVDAYFLHSHNQPYSYFHEASFRDRLAAGLLPKCIIYSVFASGIRFANLEYFRGTAAQAIEEYARSAWLAILTDHMVAENCPNLYVAQATNMLAVVDFTAGRTSSGWLKIGLAVRIAQDLQLMSEPKSALGLTACEEEERRRTFWSIYLLDKLVSCGQSRPPAIADEDCHVQLPCTQEAFSNGHIPKTATLHALLGWNSDATLGAGKASAFTLVVLSGSALGRCARYGLHQRDVEDALPWDSKSEFASHGSTLLLVEHHLQAEAQLQPLSALAGRYRRPDGTIDHDITSHIVFARTTFHLAYCLLNHSFLLRLRLQKLACRTPPTFLARSAELCLTHARALIELLHDAAAAGLHVQSSFYAYSVAVAGSLLSLGMHEARLANHEPDSKIVVAHQLSLSMLQEIGQVWEHASKMYFQLLLFDNQGLSLAQSLNNTIAGEELNPVVEAVFWSMVNYDTMCNSSGPVEALLGSVSMDQITLPGSVDLALCFGSVDNNSSDCFPITTDDRDAATNYPVF